MYNDRLVWLECFEIHPKCWSLDNIKMIGEKWGSVLHVDHDVNGISCLTFARILVQTKAMTRIDKTIKMEWGTGSCIVWVKETSFCDCKDLGIFRQLEPEQDESDTEINGDMPKFLEPNMLNDAVTVPTNETSNDDNMLNGVPIVNTQPTIVQQEDFLEMAVHTQEQPYNFDDLFVCNSCPNEQNTQEWFDPIANLDAELCSSFPVPMVNDENRCRSGRVTFVGETSNKRPRGRPKKVSRVATDCSRGCPPTSCIDSEIHETWNTVKILGVSSSDEGAVLSELRKSKRILNMENNPS